MARLTEEKFVSQVDEVVNMVNENHEKYLKEQLNISDNNNAFSALKKKILSRIMGYRNEIITKKVIIAIKELNSEKLNIRKSDGSSAGIINLSKCFEEKISMKFEIVNNKPIFTLYRGNEVYLNESVLEGKGVAKFVKKETLNEITDTIKEVRPLVDSAREIYELVENKQYSLLDKYITDCMVKIIENDGLNLSSVDINNLHTQLQVQYREIQRTKMEIATAGEVTENHRELLKRLDNLYMVICTSLINMGLIELPNLEDEKITRI